MWFSGTPTAPACQAPSRAIRYSRQFGANTATRSPSPTPVARRNPANRAAFSANSA